MKIICEYTDVEPYMNFIHQFCKKFYKNNFKDGKFCSTTPVIIATGKLNVDLSYIYDYISNFLLFNYNVNIEEQYGDHDEFLGYQVNFIRRV